MASVAQLPPAPVVAGTVTWLNQCIERSKHGIFAEQTLLTPGLAGELLRRNPDNRHIQHLRANRMATDIRGGRWKLNGEALIVSSDGLLNDGQHRAQAVIDANQPIPVLIIFGVARETRTTVDQGIARTAAHYLAMLGVENSAICASVARMTLSLERSEGKSTGGPAAPSHAEIIDRVLLDQDVGRAAVFGAHHSRRTQRFAAPSVIAFAYYSMREIDENDADDFMTQVCTGEGLKINDAAYTLREKLLAEDKTKDRKLALIFRAWNFHRRDMKVKPNSLTAVLPLPALI